MENPTGILIIFVDGRRHTAAADRPVHISATAATSIHAASCPNATGTRFATWITDEPSERGIEGLERMRLVRDDIADRVRSLAADFGIPAAGSACDRA